MSYVGAAPIVAAVPTDAFGDPLVNPFNTIGAPAPVTQTATVMGAQAAETDAFGNPFDSPYSPNEKDAAANSSSFQDLSAAALANVDAQAPTTNATEFTNSTDSSFITIPDLENQYAIFANDETGNLEIAIAADGSRFVSEGGYVVGDESRFFHFYPDVMQEYGVSRIRPSNASEIPKTSHFISLTPVNYNDNNETENVYAGVDTLANYYFLATCNIQNQASKIFLVADPEEGLTKLLDEQLRFTVTGGVVEVCYFISWTQPPSPAALQPGPAILPVIESISAAPPSPISAAASGAPPASTDASSPAATSTSAPEDAASEPAAASSATPAAVSAPDAASLTPPAAPSSVATPPAQTSSAENTSGGETENTGNAGSVDTTGNTQNTDSAPQTPDVADVGPVQVGA